MRRLHLSRLARLGADLDPQLPPGVWILDSAAAATRMRHLLPLRNRPMCV